jgi:glycosyltransferase involved in cell wall biosynthesis
MFKHTQADTSKPVKVSFVIEWANTEYNGVPRFFTLLDIFAKQWKKMSARKYPDTLPLAAKQFLENLNPIPEVLVVSGEEIDSEIKNKIKNHSPDIFIPGICVNKGLEYYALKNYGATFATGEIICFLDSDIHPDDGWLMHLLGSFADPEIRAIAGQPYVEQTDLFSRAFALGWTYQLPSRAEHIVRSEKWYANNVAFRAEIFHKVTFPKLERRTRGSRHLLDIEFAKLGYVVYENRQALVTHPAPSGWKHLIIRALAHGRDIYMTDSEDRNLAGLFYSQKLAAKRLFKGINNTFRYWHKVGLKRVDTIPAIMIITCYYVFFSIGGILTHISPAIMGRHFRL